MKLIPRRDQAIGRILIKRTKDSKIVRPDETKNTTKFVLLDAVGAGAAAAGHKVGDVVLVSKLGNIVLDGGAYFRPIVDEKDIVATVANPDLSEFVVQNDSGSKHVPLDDAEAAEPLGAQPPMNGVAAAAVAG